MPFALNEVYETIKAAVTGAEVCFHCTRADEFLHGGRVMSDILEAIGRAEIVLADLTGTNPNVMYELGIAHIVKDSKKVIIITQDPLTKLPFDVEGLRVVQYDSSDKDGLKNQLVKIFSEIGEYSWTFDLDDGRSWEANHNIVGRDDEYFYTFGLLQAEVGMGGAAFRLRVRQRQEGIGLVEFKEERHTLRVGASLRIPGLGWHLKLWQSQHQRATFGVGRGEVDASDPSRPPADQTE